MEVLQIVKQALSILKTADVSACLIGEIALNYYNVPRVVHVSTLLAYQALPFLTTYRISRSVYLKFSCRRLYLLSARQGCLGVRK
jgi:hypothetical protein